MQLPFYKRDPASALGGMRGLTMEQRAVYNTVLDLFFNDGGPVGIIAVSMEYEGVQRRKIVRIINELIRLGKLDRIGTGMVTNCRAAFELEHMEDRATNRNPSARRRAYRAWCEDWRKLRSNDLFKDDLSNDFNEGAPAKVVHTGAHARGPDAQNDDENASELPPNVHHLPVSPKFRGEKPNEIKGGQEAQEKDKEKEEDIPPVGPPSEIEDEDDYAIPAKPQPRRLRRAPASFTPSMEHLTDAVVAMVDTWADGEFQTECDKFKDHEFATPKSDWPGTFRNWCRTHHENRKARRTPDHGKSAEQILAEHYAGPSG